MHSRFGRKKEIKVVHCKRKHKKAKPDEKHKPERNAEDFAAENLGNAK